MPSFAHEIKERTGERDQCREQINGLLANLEYESALS